MAGMKALTTFLGWGWIKSWGSLGYSDTRCKLASIAIFIFLNSQKFTKACHS